MLTRLFYNALLPVGVLAGHAAALWIPKVREAIAGRAGFRERWAALSEEFARIRPVWFHVASVGEFEQARPVISEIVRKYPDTPIVVTFSSPSGYAFAQRKESIGPGCPIRFVDYLPFDSVGNMRFCLRCLNPRLLVFVKFDLWPNLIWECRQRGTPVMLIDATLSQSSRRNTRLGRAFYGPLYAAFNKILAISSDDAERFRAATPDHVAIDVSGDTRFDRVMERWELRSPIGFKLAEADGNVVIAGSTWPGDETHLLGALAMLLAADSTLRVVIAPHEPHAEHVDGLRRWAASHRLRCGAVTDGVLAADHRVIILDTVGVLAEAYRLGDVAYVGGSFSTGVHSVIEPAIAGLPVVFGPVHDNSHEALTMAAQGAAFAAKNQAEITSHLERLLTDQGARAAAGAAARRYVDSQIGATEKCVAAINEFL